jgi:hypothetical protein
MASYRPFLLAAVLAAPMSLVACGGNDTVIPEGPHYHYVASHVLVPSNNNESREYGLDLNGDGTVDNQLGNVISTLNGFGFDIQSTIDKAVFGGNLSLLADFQTKDFTTSSAAGIQVFLGANPMPAACNGGEMVTCTTAKPAVCTGCQHQFDGTATFDIAPGSPTNAALGGHIVGGTFQGGPGDLALQIALSGSTPVELDLIGARAKASSISDTGIGSFANGTVSGGIVFAGALSKDDIHNKVIPAVTVTLQATIAKDCTGVGGPPTCGCADSSSGGAQILSFLDKSPVDCMVTADEIEGNMIVSSLLAPDVVINGTMALSLGIKAVAVKATYTAPGETM